MIVSLIGALLRLFSWLVLLSNDATIARWRLMPPNYFLKLLKKKNLMSLYIDFVWPIKVSVKKGSTWGEQIFVFIKLFGALLELCVDYFPASQIFSTSVLKWLDDPQITSGNHSANLKILWTWILILPNLANPLKNGRTWVCQIFELLVWFELCSDHFHWLGLLSNDATIVWCRLMTH